MKAFTELGTFLREFCEYDNDRGRTAEKSSPWFSKLERSIIVVGHQNRWFTKENVLFALQNWGNLLTKKNLERWLSTYDLKKNAKKTVALIMAGNIPLVGFHDFLCVLLTGNKALVKLSDGDKILLPLLSQFLKETEPSLKEEIEFVDGKLGSFDTVIATGSNNTARYFEYYFGSKPNIIRKNRNSIAVLTGDESASQLEALGNDIFRYYGLGCRSVSKIFVPEGYNFDALFESIYAFKGVMDQDKYINNYDYNKAVYLMSDFKILDNGFLILREDNNYSSPIASLNYGFYSSQDELKERLVGDKNELQCIVSSGFIENEIEFGESQNPRLKDYADGIDTVDFLLKT
ncbi:MAG: acyl-CoA reductase [Aurantibacter sp.]